ncbi:MAG: hypothetical protein ACPGVN_08430 [Alphaproteobacteria bacterium]
MLKHISLLFILSLTTTGLSAQQEPWLKLNHDQIQRVMVDTEVAYKGESRVTQTFHGDGTTTYISGRPSLGKWQVRGNKYCSVWPPSESWSCFEIFQDQSKSWIRFVGERNDVWDGEIQKPKALD